MKGPDAQVPSKPAPAAAQITRQGLNVSLKQILAFLSVAQTENFTTSATALCTTQSAVSNLIKELERELDLQLFARTTRSVRLTDAGREFLDSAERVYAELQSAVSKAKTLSKQRHGQVRVAASPLMASLVLPEAIAKFHAMHPNISVVLRDAPYDQVRRLVIDGAAEIGFGLMPDADQGLNGELLSSGALSLIFPSGHPLEKVKTLTWQEVATYPFIALTSENGTRQTAEQCATECGVVLKPAYEVSFIWTAISMVEAGFGVCVVPCYVRALRGMNVCKIQAGETKASIALISRSEVPLSPAAKSFRDFIWDYID
jgi:LysR family transcriptional regulator, carnitine catabolism transcriptional activator